MLTYKTAPQSSPIIATAKAGGQREGGADGPRPELVDAPLLGIQNFTNLLEKK